MPGLEGGDHWAGKGDSEARLFKFRFLCALTGVLRFEDVHFPGVDADVALRGDDGAAGLLVGISGDEADVAAEAAHCTAGLEGVGALVIRR